MYVWGGGERGSVLGRGGGGAGLLSLSLMPCLLGPNGLEISHPIGLHGLKWRKDLTVILYRIVDRERLFYILNEHFAFFLCLN